MNTIENILLFLNTSEFHTYKIQEIIYRIARNLNTNCEEDIFKNKTISPKMERSKKHYKRCHEKYEKLRKIATKKIIMIKISQIEKNKNKQIQSSLLIELIKYIDNNYSYELLEKEIFTKLLNLIEALLKNKDIDIGSFDLLKLEAISKRRKKGKNIYYNS